MEARKLNALITSIVKGAAKQRDIIHEALVGCAYQAAFHRNTDPARRLFEGIGNGVHKRAMSQWLSLNAPIHFNDERPVLSDARQKGLTVSEAEFHAELGAAPKWYEHNARSNSAANAWDSMERVRGLVEYIEALKRKALKNDATLATDLDRVELVALALITKMQHAE